MSVHSVACVLSLVLVASSAEASFTGSAIRLEVFSPTTSSAASVPATAVASPGAVEFTDVSRFEIAGGPVRLVQTAIDVQASSITIDFDHVTFAAFGNATFNGYVLTDVDDTLPDFTGISVDASVTTLGLTAARVWVTPNQIFINVQGLGFSAATFAKLDVQFGSSTTPSGLFAQSIVGNFVTLRWNAPTSGPAPTGYLLDGGLFPGQMFVTVPTGHAGPIFAFTAPNGAFYVRIRAIVGGQPSAPTNEIRIFVNMPVAPSTPSHLTGLVNGNAMALSWRVTFAGGSPLAFILDVSGAVNTSLPIGLADRFVFPAVPNGTYTFAVRAVNLFGASAASDPVTLTFPGACSGVPTTPAHFLASNVGNILRVMWDPAASGAAPTHFRLNVAGAFNGAVPYFFRDLITPVPPGTYTLSVSAVNACGVSVPTAPQTVVIP